MSLSYNQRKKAGMKLDTERRKARNRRRRGLRDGLTAADRVWLSFSKNKEEL